MIVYCTCGVYDTSDYTKDRHCSTHDMQTDKRNRKTRVKRLLHNLFWEDHRSSAAVPESKSKHHYLMQPPVHRKMKSERLSVLKIDMYLFIFPELWKSIVILRTDITPLDSRPLAIPSGAEYIASKHQLWVGGRTRCSPLQVCSRFALLWNYCSSNTVYQQNSIIR